MLLADVWRQAWRVPDRRPIYDFVRRDLTGRATFLLPSIYTRNANGEFDISSSRQFIKVFDALHNDSIRKVTLLAPPRSGKSMVADLWIPSVLVRDPGPVMWNMQSNPLSTRHFATRVLPIFKSNEELRGLLPKRFKQTEVIFINGIPFCIDGPSIGNLQSIGIRYKVNDECWIWPAGRLKEANARVRDFEKMGISKVLNISQGGYEEEDLDEEWQDGDQQEWNVACLHCGKYHQPEIRGFRDNGSRWGIRFDGDQGATARAPLEDRIGRILATVRYECPHCGQVTLNTERTEAEWNRLGEYVPTNKDARPDTVSFHFPSTICRPWVDIVTDFLKAMEQYKAGSLEGLVVFCQKDEARSWSELRTLNADPMRREKFDITEKWEKEYVRLMEVDRQMEGLNWGTVWALSKPDALGRMEIRRLWFGKLFGEGAIKAKQEQFKIKPHHVAIDSGYETRETYAWCVRNGWLALKGDDDRFFIHNGAKPGQRFQPVRRSTAPMAKGDPEVAGALKRYARLIRWSNPSIKDRLKRILDNSSERGPRIVIPLDSLSAEMEKEFQTQMRAEYPKLTVDKVTGKRKRVWVCPSGNNHGFDCTCMLIVQLTLLKILTDDVVQEDSRGDLEKAA